MKGPTLPKSNARLRGSPVMIVIPSSFGAYIPKYHQPVQGWTKQVIYQTSVSNWLYNALNFSLSSFKASFMVSLTSSLE